MVVEEVVLQEIGWSGRGFRWASPPPAAADAIKTTAKRPLKKGTHRQQIETGSVR